MIRTPDDQARLVELLRQHRTEVLLVDPFGRAYTGKSQNDPGAVTHWLADLDRFAVDVGASEVVLNTHAGWAGERSRGASALEDWPDAVAILVKDDDGARYLQAIGRDVEVDEDRLYFEPATRTLTLTGTGSRKQSQAERAVAAVLPDVLEFVRENTECSGQQIRNGVDGTGTVIDRARHLLAERGEIIEEPRRGRGGGKAYRAVDKPDSPETSSNPVEPRRDEVGTPSTPSYTETGFQDEVPSEVRRTSGTVVEIEPRKPRSHDL